VAVAWLAQSTASAQTAAVSHKHHPWARFKPGAWARVKKHIREFDAQGNVQSSTTETKTVLTQVDADGCTIQLQVTIEVAGKRFNAQPRQVRLGLYGETNGDQAVVRKLRSEPVDVGGKPVPCEVLEATIHREDKQVVSLIWYCPSKAPFILKRTTKLTDEEGGVVQKEANESLIAVDMPHKVVSEAKSTAYFRTVETHAKGSTVTLEVRCVDVPGGVVAHSSKELDDKGKVVRQSTLELLEYGFEEEPQLVPRRPLLFRHYRIRR
jgi:hypothetical protein